MAVLLTGAALLGTSLLAQVLFRNVWVPKRRMRALLVLFAVVPACALLLAWLAGHPVVLSPAQTVGLALFYAAFSLGYIVLFSAIEAESPTLAIVAYIAPAGAAGRSDAELHAVFGRDATMTARFERMELSGWVRSDGGMTRLTPQGRFFAELFERTSRVFGLPSTGG